MKKLLIAVASVVLALLPGERASAMTCTQQVCPTGGLFGPCQCIAADPDPPPGFATCTVGQPAVGECKFYTRTGGEGYCFKRSFPSGQNTNVTDKGLEYLKELTKLRRLELVETETTRAGVEELHNALPKCNIYVTRRGSHEVFGGGPDVSLKEPFP